MARRIQDHVVRGEIDNREPGLVRGRLWLQGLTEPVVLELKGNAAPDLAGCLLTFANPETALPLNPGSGLSLLQEGTVGDLTASRKVRVPDLPLPEALERWQHDLPVPEHLANCLYLEWFSQTDGRVVIESPAYALTLSAPVWRLSAEEELLRRGQVEAGFDAFMDKLSAALAAQTHDPPEDKEWDEFDYEKFMRECDARTEKYSELMDKYLDHPDRDQIIAREMGWSWLEAANEAAGVQFEGDLDAGPADPPEPLPALEPDPATEGVDWQRHANGNIGHPLALRALDGSLALWRQVETLGLRRTDPDLSLLLSEYHIISAKLAGALDGLAYGRFLNESPFIVAYLKRALSHVHAAQAALERVTTRRLLPEDLLQTTRADFFSLRDGILRLMQEFRREAADGEDPD